MELSRKEDEAAKEKARREELQMQIAVEKAKLEAENAAALQAKNEELDKLKAELAGAKKQQEQESEAKRA